MLCSRITRTCQSWLIYTHSSRIMIKKVNTISGMADFSERILSIQSHVVSGYVGNKSATFPLQLLGFETDCINSVQFSNHTGYERGAKGECLSSSQLWHLIEGLKQNGLDNYSLMISGYIGEATCLSKAVNVIRCLKEKNPDLFYICDPVMGDSEPVGWY